MKQTGTTPREEKKKAFARAVSTLPGADEDADANDEVTALQAVEIHEDMPPDDLAWVLTDLFNGPDGRWGLFRRNGEIIAWDEEKKDFSPMTAKRFRTWLPRHRGVVIIKKKIPAKDEQGKNTGDWIVIKGQLTKDKAEVVLANDEFRAVLPEITAFHPVRMPVIDAAGEMRLLKPGYDEATGIFTMDSCPFDEHWAFDEAIHWGYRVFRTFGWRSEDRDMAIHFAAMQSVFCRALYAGKAPAFAYVANIQSSGKTNLAWCGPWAVYGSRKTKPLLKDQEARLQETLNSMALAGVGYTIFDNIDWKGEMIQTELLDQWISNAEWDFRRLQVNEMLSPKLIGVTFLTGNNIKLSPDLDRRTLLCDLWNPLSAADRPKDPNMVLIDEPFFSDQANRAKMLAFLWSMVKAWDEAGRPRGTRELDSFEGWSRIVPGIVLNAGTVFERSWDCMAQNANEEVGDKAAKDFRKLAELAMAEHGRDRHSGQMKDAFEVTVQQLAAITRLNTLEECQFALYPEKDIESALKELHPNERVELVPGENGKPGVWKLADQDLFESAARAAQIVKEAAEYLTPATRSKFGNAIKSRLNQLYFKGPDDCLYQWQQRKGVTPARYAVTRVKPRT